MDMEMWIRYNFNQVPTDLVEKLMFDYDSVWEIPAPEPKDDHYVEALPMWGTMWSLGNFWQNYMDRDDFQTFWDNGFRVFDSEDLGYIVGIDGAGYDFYEAHWEGLREGLEGAMR